MIGTPLLAPVRRTGVCARCYTPVRADQTYCRACGSGHDYLAAMAPIAFSVAGESLHHEIACYKRDADPAVDVAVDHLSLLLDRFLIQHEACVAEAAGLGAGAGGALGVDVGAGAGGGRFDLVCTIPSGYAARPGRHPLERIVGERLRCTASRWQPLLVRAPEASRWRLFDPTRFDVAERLSGESVLVIDDMWTTGATAQSAAAALKRAGAGTVAAVVIARHIKRAWADNEAWLRESAAPLRFDRCVYCASGGRSIPETAAA